MSETQEFARALMRRLIELHNQDGINMLTPQDMVWQLVKAVGHAGDLIETTSPQREVGGK